MKEDRYTFQKRYGARTASVGELVYVPDQVIEAQERFDGKRFPIMRRDGTRRLAILRGMRYGLGSQKQGDPVVALT